MVETAGIKLRRARQLRQLSIEDASRATRIRVRQIADLEADDYSNFANLAYAKSFLIAYGKYLSVDTRAYMDAFADANTFGLDDYQYLSDRPVGVYRSTRHRPRPRAPRRKQFIAAGATVGIVAILLFGRLAYITVQRLGDLDKLAARREAREHPAPVAAPTAATPGLAFGPPDDASAHAASAPLVPVELPALASPAAPVAEAGEPVPPPVPLPGDGAAVRGLLAAPSARKPAFDAPPPPRVDEPQPQPQRVVNYGPRPPVN